MKKIDHRNRHHINPFELNTITSTKVPGSRGKCLIWFYRTQHRYKFANKLAEELPVIALKKVDSLLLFLLLKNSQ